MRLSNGWSALLAGLCLASGALAADAPAVPRMSNGKPDLSGHWNNPYFPDMAAKGQAVDPKTRKPLEPRSPPFRMPKRRPPAPARRTVDLPYTSWGLERWKNYDPVNDGDYAGSCLPFGMSRNINSPHGLQIVQNPEAFALLFEQNTWFHWVPTAGPEVAGRHAFVMERRLDGTLGRRRAGRGDDRVQRLHARSTPPAIPHSKQLKLINTFRRIDARTIEHTVTVHDPKTYTRDWMNVRTWKLKARRRTS